MSALIEKEIEAKVIDGIKVKIESLDSIPSYRIDGSWQSSNNGEVKGLEESAEDVIIGVAVSGPSFESWTVPLCDVSVAIGVTVRHECAPTASELSAIMEPIAEFLVSLQTDSAESAHEALSTDSFTCDGMKLDQGEPPTFNSSLNSWRVARSFTVRGIIG